MGNSTRKPKSLADSPADPNTGVNTAPKKHKQERKYYVPPKPKGFPLTPHASGKWMMKIKGKLCYFGNWGRIKDGKMVRLPGDGRDEAKRLYLEQRDDLERGRTPAPEIDDKLTVKQLCNLFLTRMHERLQAGNKMSPRMFAEYRATAETMAAAVGKNRQVSSLRPLDFTSLGDVLRKRFTPVRLGNEVQRVKTIFKFAVENELIPKSPNYGSEFKKPDKTELRKHRATTDKRLFSAEEIRWLLDGKSVKEGGAKEHLEGAAPQLRAMILLGINCGFGNSDVSSLTKSVVDLDGALIAYPRPKTGVERRCPLWPETVAAIQAALAQRPDPKDKADADCVFITKQGNRWVRDRMTTKPGDDESDFTNTKVTPINSVGLEFGKVMRRVGINGRSGVGFYSLRHSFRTVADATKDFVAVRLIMGHADNSIDAVYREHVDDDRLEAVAAHVRKWLFGDRVK